MTMERNNALIGELCQAMLDGADDPLARAGEAVGLLPIADKPEVECDACGGEGWTWKRLDLCGRIGLHDVTCAHCNGHGWREERP